MTAAAAESSRSPIADRRRHRSADHAVGASPRARCGRHVSDAASLRRWRAARERWPAICPRRTRSCPRRDVGRRSGDRRSAIAIRTSRSPESLLRRTVTTRRRRRAGVAVCASTRRARCRRRRRFISTSTSKRAVSPGQTTDVVAAIAGARGRPRVARVDGGRERWRASIDAVPIGEPPYVVPVRLSRTARPNGIGQPSRAAGVAGPSAGPSRTSSSTSAEADPRRVLRSAAVVGDDVPATGARSGRAVRGRPPSSFTSRGISDADRRRGRRSAIRGSTRSTW